MVVDVKTTEADVIARYISFLFANVIANPFVVDVMTTCYSMRRCLLMAGMFLPCICVIDVITIIFHVFLLNNYTDIFIFHSSVRF